MIRSNLELSYYFSFLCVDYLDIGEKEFVKSAF